MTNRITDDELDALADLEAKATPVPWGGSECPQVHMRYKPEPHKADADDSPVYVQISPENRAILFASRNALPRLIAEVRELRKEAMESDAALRSLDEDLRQLGKDYDTQRKTLERLAK